MKKRPGLEPPQAPAPASNMAVVPEPGIAERQERHQRPRRSRSCWRLRGRDAFYDARFRIARGAGDTAFSRP